MTRYTCSVRVCLFTQIVGCHCTDTCCGIKTVVQYSCKTSHLDKQSVGLAFIALYSRLFLAFGHAARKRRAYFSA